MIDYTFALNYKAKLQGATILEHKATDYDADHRVVLAKNDRNEYVTWVYANDGFHHGHYFNQDIATAAADYSERES